eukprot:8112852-Lingulodinium_polyedra.AAC.1
MKDAQRLVVARRGTSLTGAEAAASLLKTGLSDAYGTIPRSGPHVVMRAAAIDEPRDDGAVDMLSALP